MLKALLHLLASGAIVEKFDAYLVLELVVYVTSLSPSLGNFIIFSLLQLF